MDTIGNRLRQQACHTHLALPLDAVWCMRRVIRERLPHKARLQCNRLLFFMNASVLDYRV